MCAARWAAILTHSLARVTQNRRGMVPPKEGMLCRQKLHQPSMGGWSLWKE